MIFFQQIEVVCRERDNQSVKTCSNPHRRGGGRARAENTPPHGSHGMGFLHKLSLAVLLLIEDLVIMVASCGELALGLGSAGTLVLGFVGAHLVELRMRRLFAEKERLRHAYKYLLATSGRQPPGRSASGPSR